MDGDGSDGLREPDSRGRKLRVDGMNSRWLEAGLKIAVGDLGPAGSLRHRVATRATVATLAVMMLAFSIAPLVNVARNTYYNKDYDLWQGTGRVVLAGQDIYPRTPGLFPFMYPPSCATMLAPLAPLTRGWFVAALLLLNSASWTSVIVASVYLATGRVRGVHPGLFLYPSIAVIPFVHDTYLLGQPALLLLALLLGAFVAIRKGWPVTAGALVAVSAGIKAFPILAVGYFVYRRQWRATAATIATLLVLTFVAPLAFRSPVQVAEDFTFWAKGMLFKYDEESIGQRPDRAYSFKNQSIQATVHRLARPVLADGEADRRWQVNLISLDFASVTSLMLGLIGAMGLFTLWSTWKSGKEPPPSDAVEHAMVALLILMLAPLSFNYSYVWLIFPLTVLGHFAGNAPAGSSLKRWSLGSIVLSVGLLALALPFRRTSQAYGNIFFSGLVPFISLGVILHYGWITQLRRPNPALVGPRDDLAGRVVDGSRRIGR